MTTPAAALPSQCETIVIGGGHNGLVCAAYLARAGRPVLLLEAADRLGGAAVTRPFAPGFSVSACAHLLHMLPDRVAQDLELARFGLTFAAREIATTALSPHGTHLRLDPAGAVSPDYAAFSKRMRRFARHLRPLMDMTPPRLGVAAWADRGRLLRIAWQVRSLGRNDMRELLRIAGMNVHDLTEDWLEPTLLRGAVAFDAVLGASLGPRAPGTVLNLLYRLAAEQGGAGLRQPRGGMGAVSEAIAASARAAGATLRTGAPVARILVDGDRAAGVHLASGETISARHVVSGIDPRATFLDLLGAAHLDTGFVRRVSHLRTRGMTGKLHLALAGLPRFSGLPPASLADRLIVAPSSEYLEQAHDHIKYDELPDAPALEVTIPTVADPALAPPGQHVLSAIVQYMPHLTQAAWKEARDGVTRRLIQILDDHAPGLRALVRHAELLTPVDLGREFGLPGGNWHHGELAFDQFFMMRPVPGAAGYRTPVDGVFMCSAGTHPGGGVMGVAGRNAAREVLKHAA